jgi:hypothetical protein
MDPSKLLLGLPGLACECLLQHLVAAGSKKLVELMRCSRVTRALVLQHAHNMRYKPGRRVNHATLHAAASRNTDLGLILDLTNSTEDALAQLLLEANLQSKPVNSSSTASHGADCVQPGWKAVKILSVWVGDWVYIAAVDYKGTDMRWAARCPSSGMHGPIPTTPHSPTALW